MKLRIKGNSLRLRLTKSDVSKLAKDGIVEEKTHFVNSELTYSLESSKIAHKISASFKSNAIKIIIPVLLIENWPTNHIISFDEYLNEKDRHSLHILVEKDFMCIDETTEDQSDNFENPAKIF